MEFSFMPFRTAKNIVENIRKSAASNAVNLLIDGGDFILFFTDGKGVYAADESARVTFAKLMDPDDEDNDVGFQKNAYFTALDIVKLAQGNRTPIVFNAGDLPSIKVISDRDKLRQIVGQLLGSD